MKSHRPLILAALLLLTVAPLAQAQEAATGQPSGAVAPSNDHIDAVQLWGKESRLGNLSQMPLGRDDIELRVWGGFGFGSHGVVLRRMAGHWSVWTAEILDCETTVTERMEDARERQIRLAKTFRELSILTSTTLYEQSARRNCGTPPPNRVPSTPTSYSFVIAIDSVVVHSFEEDELPDIAPLWAALVTSGVGELPTPGPGNRIGFTYVVELKRGNSYQASVFGCAKSPGTDVQRQMKAIVNLVAEKIPDQQWAICK